MSAERVYRGRVHGGRRREPFDSIRVGSVIRWRGRLRTVRSVARTPDGLVQVITFAKLQKSGYDWPYTSYWRSEIRTSFDGIVAHRKLPLCATDLECKVQREIEYDGPSRRPLVTQDDSVGTIW